MFHLLLVIIYISFISLGLPDALLGAAWPKMYLDLNTNVSYAGIIFMIISCGTSLCSASHELASLHVGSGSHGRALCYGICTFPRMALDKWVSYHCNFSVGINLGSILNITVVERT